MCLYTLAAFCLFFNICIFLLTEIKDVHHSITEYGSQKKFVDTVFDVNSKASKEAVKLFVDAGTY